MTTKLEKLVGAYKEKEFIIQVLNGELCRIQDKITSILRKKDPDIIVSNYNILDLADLEIRARKVGVSK